jgi:small subunit ribosomal protein S16
MALKIRLSRGGSKKRPFYRIVVAEAAAPRDGRYVERIGHYNPMLAKDNDQRMVIDGERVKHWIGLGAKPTERVQKLLSTLSLTAPVEMRDQPKKSAPGKKRAEREAEEAAAAEAAAEAPAESTPAEAAVAEEATAEAEAPAEETPAAAAAAEAPAEEAGAEAETPAEEEKPADA